MPQTAAVNLAAAEALRAFGELAGRRVAFELRAGDCAALCVNAEGELRETFSAFEGLEDLDTVLVVQVDDVSATLWAGEIKRFARYRRPTTTPGEWLMRVAIELRDGTVVGLRELD